ncbi:hypothetical protein LXL04_039171 [Taraxacum kok-saghyz]
MFDCYGVQPEVGSESEIEKVILTLIKKGDILFDKQEDGNGNLNLLLMSNGSPEPTSSSLKLDNLTIPEKKRRGSKTRAKWWWSGKAFEEPEQMVVREIQRISLEMGSCRSGQKHHIFHLRKPIIDVSIHLVIKFS